MTPSGGTSTFFQGDSTPGATGLTTALGVLKNRYVIVGNLPTTDGTSETLQAPGSLLILDKNGNLVETLTDNVLLDGPWDLTIHDAGNHAQVYVSNVLNGTVTRINLQVRTDGSAPIVNSETMIGSGYAHTTDPAALVLGPTGLAFDALTDTLFVASTKDNAVYAIHNAQFAHRSFGKGTLIYQDSTHLHGPLALVLAPNGNLITANGDAVNPDSSHFSELTQFTRTGKFVSQFQVDSQIGGAFGAAIETSKAKPALPP